MHENRAESLIIWQSRLLILSMYIFVPMHQFQKEIQLIKRNKASKVFICSCYARKQDQRLLFEATDPRS